MKRRLLAVFLAAALFVPAFPAALADGAPARLDIMTQAVYDELGVPSEGLIWALRDGKFSYLDENGKTVISSETLQAACGGETVYDARGFHEGTAVIYAGDRAYYIDKQGKPVFSAEWGHSFSGGVAIGRANGELALFDTAGKAQAVALPAEALQADDWDCGILFRDGLLPFWVTVNGAERGGYVDTAFRAAIPFQFEDARPFHDGLAPVKKDRKWGFIDKEGQMVIAPEYDDFMADGADYAHQVFRDGLAAVKKDGKWGYIGRDGHVAVPFTWDYADQFSGGYAVVGSGREYGYIDATGKTVIPPQYEDANGFADGMALVGAGGEYAFIAPDGSRLSRLAWGFDGTLIAPDAPRTALYTRGGKWGLVKIGGDPLDSASDWAHTHIRDALAKGFVPEQLQGSYAQPVTRAEFVYLAMSWLTYHTGLTADELAARYAAFPDRTFVDVDDDPVLLAAGVLDITSGTDAERKLFGPGLTFTRQQAAVMLVKVHIILGYNTGGAPEFGFADLIDADGWAWNAINFVGGHDVMAGVGNDKFDPHGTFSREHSITVFNKMG